MLRIKVDLIKWTGSFTQESFICCLIVTFHNEWKENWINLMCKGGNKNVPSSYCITMVVSMYTNWKVWQRLCCLIKWPFIMNGRKIGSNLMCKGANKNVLSSYCITMVVSMFANWKVWQRIGNGMASPQANWENQSFNQQSLGHLSRNQGLVMLLKQRQLLSCTSMTYQLEQIMMIRKGWRVRVWEIALGMRQG